MRRSTQAGFTMIELLVALTILIVGLLGLVGIVAVALRASSFSRHGTEAAVLAEDMVEELRTQPLTPYVGGGPINDVRNPLDNRGVQNVDPRYGIFNRSFEVTSVVLTGLGPALEIDVTVTWQESGETGTPRSVTLHTERMP